jgi:hypothetical protein
MSYQNTSPTFAIATAWDRLGMFLKEENENGDVHNADYARSSCFRLLPSSEA